jgi:hypothetical protein
MYFYLLRTVKCQLQGQTVGLFNVSVRFNTGSSSRLSSPSSDSYLITPDQIIYNYQTYAGELKKQVDYIII